MSETNKKNDINLVVAFVGHIPIDDLKNFKNLIDELPYFKTIFFKTSSEKLWIKEGDNSDY